MPIADPLQGKFRKKSQPTEIYGPQKQEVKITKPQPDKYNRGLLGWLNRNVSFPRSVINTIQRSGETLVRSGATLLSTPFKGSIEDTKQAQRFVMEPFRGGKSLAEQAIDIQARGEKILPKSLRPIAGALGPTTAIGAQLAQGLGDPVNLLLGKGVMLRSPNVSIAEAFLGTRDNKPIRSVKVDSPAEQSVTAYRSVGNLDDVGTGEKGVMYYTTNKATAEAYNAKTGGMGLVQTRLNLDPKKILDLSDEAAESGYLLKAQKRFGIDGASMTPDELINTAARADGYEAVNRGINTPNGIAVLNPENAHTPTPTPFTPQSTSRVKQYQEFIQEEIQKLESDPIYLNRLGDLGGGRRVGNVETYRSALKSKPMTIEELSNWKQGTPVSETDIARAQILKNYFERNASASLEAGNREGFQKAMDDLSKIAPGYETLTATPGRALEIQKAAKSKVEGLVARVGELYDSGATFEEMQKALKSGTATMKSAAFFSKLSSGMRTVVRSLENYATGAKLTSPVTHGINFVAGGLTHAMRGVKEVIKSGVQLVEGKPREALGTLKYSFGTTTGVRTGVRKFLETLTTDNPDWGKTELSLGVPKVTGAASKSAGVLTRVGRAANPFRWLAAADNFWKGILFDSDLNVQAYTFVSRNLKKGENFAEELTKALNKPQKSWIEHARNVAKEYTFQEDPDEILGTVMKLREIPGMRFIVPFIQTPYNIVKFQLEHGATAGIMPKNLKALFTSSSGREETISRVVLGTGLTVAAWSYASQNEITGAYPKDSAERQLWIAEGRRPYSIKVGDKWVQYNRFQPLGLFLSQVAIVKDILQSKEKKGAEEAISEAVWQSANAITDLPFVQGLSSVFSALEDPERYAKNFLNQTVQGFVPNILRDIRYQTDRVQRAGEKGTMNLKESLMNMIPGLSQKLPPKVDITGKILEYESNRVLRGTKVVNTASESEITRFLRESGYNPTSPQTTITLPGGKTKELIGEERSRFLREVGEARKNIIEVLMKRKEIQNLPIELRQSIIKKAVEKVTEGVRAKYKR